MSLDHLWAGWRASYVEASGAADGVRTAPPGDGAGPGDGGSGGSGGIEGTDSVSSALPNGATAAEGDCVFCTILASGENDEHRHVVWAGEAMVAMLNAFPYSSGHLLVMPARHVRELEELSGDEATRLWQTVHRGVAALKVAYEPDGLNLGLNLGRTAGAGIPGHLHVHVVPRWLGDTNFMTTAAGVRVLPEALGVTWRRVRAAWV